MACKQLNYVNYMHINSSAYARVKGGDNEFFRIECVRQEYFNSSWLFSMYMEGVTRSENVDA